MNDSLAAPVMNNNFSELLYTYISRSMSETSRFIKSMNDRFYIMITKSFAEKKNYQKIISIAFICINDVSFH